MPKTPSTHQASPTLRNNRSRSIKKNIKTFSSPQKVSFVRSSERLKKRDAKAAEDPAELSQPLPERSCHRETPKTIRKNMKKTSGRKRVCLSRVLFLASMRTLIDLDEDGKTIPIIKAMVHAANNAYRSYIKERLHARIIFTDVHKTFDDDVVNEHTFRKHCIAHKTTKESTKVYESVMSMSYTDIKKKLSQGGEEGRHYLRQQCTLELQKIQVELNSATTTSGIELESLVQWISGGLYFLLNNYSSRKGSNWTSKRDFSEPEKAVLESPKGKGSKTASLNPSASTTVTAGENHQETQPSDFVHFTDSLGMYMPVDEPTYVLSPHDDIGCFPRGPSAEFSLSHNPFLDDSLSLEISENWIPALDDSSDLVGVGMDTGTPVRLPSISQDINIADILKPGFDDYLVQTRTHATC